MGRARICVLGADEASLVKKVSGRNGEENSEVAATHLALYGWIKRIITIMIVLVLMNVNLLVQNQLPSTTERSMKRAAPPCVWPC